MNASKISVSNLRNNLKTILKMVEGGKSVIIEAHGKAIAEIKPIEDNKVLTRKKLLEVGSKSIIGDVVSPLKIKWKESL